MDKLDADIIRHMIKEYTSLKRQRDDLKAALEDMVRHVQANFKDTDSVWVKAALAALNEQGER